MLRDAYSNASKLTIVDEQEKILSKPFDDADISQLPIKGGDGKPLLYVEHMALRNRLTEAFGIGRWIQIQRWEKFEDRIKPARGNNGPKPYQRVYVGSVLVVNGCLVAETVSHADYWGDESSSLDDTIETALSDGIRRLAGKSSLPIGSHVWLKSWRDGYWQREAEREKQARDAARSKMKKPPADKAPVAPAEPKKPAKKPDESKNWAIKLYHMYSEESPYVVKDKADILFETCPMTPFVGKGWDELKDGECIALWGRCVKSLEDKTTPTKVRQQAASLLNYIQQRLMCLKHSPHVIFEGFNV